MATTTTADANTPRLARRGRRGAAAGIAILCAVASAMLSGCETLAITALGVGASAGVQHTATAVSSRTFTASAPQVRTASLAALNRMGISVTAIDRHDDTEVIHAKSADRQIEIELEAMNKSTTQMRASAKRNLFVHDAATAREIVEQTERAMTTPERRVAAGGTPPWTRLSASARSNY